MQVGMGKRAKKKYQYRKSRQRGQAIVEFALVALPFFMLIIGILDFGYAFALQLTIDDAAREGVRRAEILASTGNLTTTNSPQIMADISTAARPFVNVSATQTLSIGVGHTVNVSACTTNGNTYMGYIGTNYSVTVEGCDQDLAAPAYVLVNVTADFNPAFFVTGHTFTISSYQEAFVVT